MKTLLLTIIVMSTWIYMKGQGVNFKSAKSWEEVRTVAKKENKYIFLDLYATWCAPCKLMDSTIYNQKSIGDIMNTKFISLKVQTDINRNDSQKIQAWYEDAISIINKYNVNRMPTYLFFSPDGIILTRDFGQKDSSNFIKMINDALDPKKQYYTLEKLYRSNNLEPQHFQELALQARKLGLDSMANAVAQNYIIHYIFKSPKDSIWEPRNLKFISMFLGDKGNIGFDFFSKYRDRINKAIGNNRSEYALRGIISKVNVPNDQTWLLKSPNWDSLENIVSKKYGELGTEVINGKRMLYSYQTKNWDEFGKYYKLYFETALKRPEYNINDISFEIFNYVNDEAVIDFACNVVMRYAMEEWYPNNPAAYDTYANLLYKTGRVDEGILWEKKAIRMVKGTQHEDEFDEVMIKMEKGIPTWSQTTEKSRL